MSVFWEKPRNTLFLLIVFTARESWKDILRPDLQDINMAFLIALGNFWSILHYIMYHEVDQPTNVFYVEILTKVWYLKAHNLN
jgi:hypothetical protein